MNQNQVKDVYQLKQLQLFTSLKELWLYDNEVCKNSKIKECLGFVLTLNIQSVYLVDAEEDCAEEIRQLILKKGNEFPLEVE